MAPVRRTLVGPVAALTLAIATGWAAQASAGSRPSSPRASTTGGQLPGNGLVAFASTRDGNSEIYTMNFDGSNQRNLTTNAATDSQPAWSPDGTKIAFTSNRDGNDEVYVMAVDGSHRVRLTTDAAADSQPAWSPDGTKIAFTSNRDGNDEVYVMNAVDGSNPVDLTNGPSSDSQPAWSPDGALIAFATTRTGNSEVFTMNADGSNPVNLTNDPSSDSQPAWSPDGAKIAFATTRTGNSEVYVMNADGSNPVNLTNDPSVDARPAFAPDQGTRVVFQTDRTGDPEIDSISLPNGSPRQILLAANLTHDGAADTEPAWEPLPPYPPSGSPIQHIVIIYEENHSFDNIFGILCKVDHRCDGATTGYLPDSSPIKLTRATPLVVQAGHDYPAQIAAINGGAMNGWPGVLHCDVTTNYECYTQYVPRDIPNITALARSFAISDRFFELDTVGSWGSHLELAASWLDGFYTAEHHGDGSGRGERGWGCDSFQLGPWRASYLDPNYVTDPPTCVPGLDGAGPFQASPVPWVPTLFNRMDEAGLPWKLYAPLRGGGYGWSICPTFGQCLDGPQRSNWVDPYEFATDAMAGDLPALSIVTPHIEDSGHPGRYMPRADNWIQTNVKAVMDGPEWGSTAILITFDDCGCFYDHVPPPPGLGLRLPLIVVSPYAKPAYTDHTVSSQGSFQAFVEHTFGLAPLSWRDLNSYDLSGLFAFTQRPLAPIKLTPTPIPDWVYRYDATHPMDPNTPDD
jgi:phospholipase C